MTTVNISVPDTMRDFINEQVAKGGYSTTSEYIRQLIRQEAERVAQVSGMTLNEASFTLDSLSRLGLVVQTSNGWVKTSNTL